MKSLKSALCLQSTYSDKGKSTTKLNDTNFDSLIPSTCARYCCTFDVVVKREMLLTRGDSDSPRQTKSKESPKQKKVTLLSAKSSETGTVVPPEPEIVYEPDVVVVHAVYAGSCCQQRLVEVRFHQRKVPRMVIQVITLYAPFYDQLAKIHIRRCPIDAYIIHDINKMIEVSNLTTVVLEDTPIPNGNYAILLESNNLKNLSLHRCKINDEICEQIAAKLHGIGRVEQNNLLFLSLSSNHITDTGANYLGNVLRTNRKLLYLNLSDNRITDTGASNLLDMLCEFPLTYDEIVGKRSRYFKYLRQRQYLDDIKTNDHSDMSSSTQSRSSEDIPLLTLRLEDRASVFQETFVEPFPRDLITVRDGWTYCKGNLVLYSLNLSYNRLSYISTKKVLHVLTYQSTVRTENLQGLMRIVIEGNPMPQTCVEMRNIRDIVDSYLVNTNNETCSERKSRAKSRVSILPRKGNDTV